MQRVSKDNPCPACGKSDYCLIGYDAAICMRVASENPHTFKDGSIGYFHRLNGAPLRPIARAKPEKRVEIDAEAMMKRWLQETRADWIARLADKLGVKGSSLLDLRAAWASEHQAWAFPMRCGATGKTVGIRFRNEKGEKWAVKGSKQGIFLPYCLPWETAYIVEGPTDCAAGLSLGLYTLGRPNCSGGLYDLKAACQRLKIGHLVIIADNDQDKEAGGRVFNPGLDGAESLVRTVCVPCCTVLLPTKDIRDFVRLGGTREDLESVVGSRVWKV